MTSCDECPSQCLRWPDWTGPRRWSCQKCDVRPCGGGMQSVWWPSWRLSGHAHCCQGQGHSSAFYTDQSLGQPTLFLMWIISPRSREGTWRTPKIIIYLFDGCEKRSLLINSLFKLTVGVYVWFSKLQTNAPRLMFSKLLATVKIC